PCLACHWTSLSSFSTMSGMTAKIHRYAATSRSVRFVWSGDADTGGGGGGALGGNGGWLIVRRSFRAAQRREVGPQRSVHERSAGALRPLAWLAPRGLRQP